MSQVPNLKPTGPDYPPDPNLAGLATKNNKNNPKPPTRGSHPPQYEQTSFDLWNLPSAAKDQPQASLAGAVTAPAQKSGLPSTVSPVLSSFEPSRYQQAIFEFAQEEQGGDGLVNAVPGSGKSTTLIEFALRLPADKRVLLVAFSKHLADELEPKLKLAGLWQRSDPATGRRLVYCQTIHSLGYATLHKALLGGKGQKLGLDEQKYDKLVAAWLKARSLNPKFYQHPLVELIRLCQLTLTDPDDKSALLEMVLYYNLLEILPVWETALTALKPILTEGERLAQEKHQISFDEMLYLPIRWNLQPQQFDWVLVDEWQDLSKAQLELLLRCRATSGRGGAGRFLFVGDQHQSIFGFNCADPRQLQHILERTQARQLALSICYRCPSSHVALAARVYPGIEASATAKPGQIYQEVREEELVTLVQPTDLILCRTTAPLIGVCFALIRAGIKAKVRGRDIGRNLKAILTPLEKQSGQPLNPLELEEYLETYQEEQLALATLHQAPETSLNLIRDKVATLRAIYQSSWPRPKTIKELKEAIGEIFSDKQASVWLSTVHRAKGLEAERVFILRPDLLPFPKASLPWEREQEWNCLYVALTRAKSSLFIIQPTSEKEEPSQSGEVEEEEQAQPGRGQARPVHTSRRKPEPEGLLALLAGEG